MFCTLDLTTKKRQELITITSMVQSFVSQTNCKSGICVVFIPHTTAAVTINEGSDADVCRDIETSLDELIPQKSSYLHAEGNSDSHMKASLIGSSVTIIIENKKLVLGTWQKIFFCEFDGPRNRQIFVKIIPTPS